MKRMMLATLSGALTMLGCASARFAKTDPAFVEQPRAEPPTLFVASPPPEKYRVVGTIEVELVDGTPDSDFESAAQSKGKEVGCDLVVDSRVHTPDQARSGDGFVLRFVHEGGEAPGRDSSGDRPRMEKRVKRDFVCGVRLAPPTS